MTKKLSISLYITSFIIVASLLIITLCSFILKDLKYYVNNSFDTIEGKTGYVITVSDINLTGTGLRINNLRITEPEKKQALLTSKNLLLKIKILPLFTGKIIVSNFTLYEPEFSISGIKNGNWTKLIKKPLSLNYRPGDNSFFKFSFNPESYRIQRGQLLYRNTSHNIIANLNEINAEITVINSKYDYNINATAKQTPDKNSALLSLTTKFSFKENNFSPDMFTADGILNISSVPSSGLIPDINNYLLPEYQGLKLNGSIKYTISPGLKFNVSGQLEPYHPNKSSLNESIFKFRSKGNKDEIIFDTINLSLFDALKLTGSVSLQNSKPKTTKIDISLLSADADINYLKQIFNLNSLPTPIPGIISKFQSGKVFIKNTQIHNILNIPDKSDSTFWLNGNCELFNSTLNISSRFPLLNISNSQLTFNNNVLTGTAAVHIFKNDNSTLDIKIIDPFKEPDVTLLIDSRFSAETVDKTIQKILVNRPDLNISEYLSGIITAKTTLQYNKTAKIASAINLTSTEYNISNKIRKPKNLQNIIALSTQFNNKNNIIAFTYSIKKSLILSGKINSLKPISLNGKYKLHRFNTNSLIFPLFPEDMTLSGKVSGTGNVNIQSANKDILPFTGSIKVDKFTIMDKTDSTDLISADLTAKIQKNNLLIQSSRVLVGETDIHADGNLTSALPLKGDLRLNVDYFDIDEFVRKIRTIIIHSKKKLPKKPSSPNPFLKTDLDIDLKVKKVNFLKWDFEKATSNFTYIGSTLTWDNVHLYSDNGTAQGRVIYDYSNPARYRLEFHPSKTDLDFTTLIPMFRKNKKITGNTNLSGSFTSTYKKGEEIIPNMNGLFNIQVQNGEIRRSKLFSKSIAKARQKNKISPDAPNKIYKSMPFNLIDADFSIKNSIIKTDNLILTSPAINLTAIGTINLKKKDLDFTVGTQVLKTIGKILGNIPIAGDLFTIDNKALTLGYFKVNGSFNSPSVKALPFKSLGLGIKRFFFSILDIPMIFIPDKTDDNETDATSPLNQ